MTCRECGYFDPSNKRCRKFKTVIALPDTPNDCVHFSSEIKIPPKNKGLQIRDNKLKKQQKKMRTVKEGQEDLCRFVWIEYLIFKKVNGKTKPYKTVANVALQIGNKAYQNDGTYKFVNNKNLKIKRVYDGIPDAANESLIERYKAFQEGQ